ncbi:DNA polymerase III subunit chi [Alsobacter sp. SYSU BS001988]
MAEILFYHLLRQDMEAVLPQLLERSVARGWRAVVHAPSPERVAALDDHLWTFSEESFLPHASDRDPGAAGEPIVITTELANPNQAQVRFLVDGAPIPPDADAYQRLVLIFDGRDDEAVAAARVAWKTLKGRDPSAPAVELSYWQQNDTGRWERKA